MAEVINFNRDRARYLHDRLAHGKPIEGVRTVNDFLALAGACLFIARSHGPLPERARKGQLDLLAAGDIPPEFLIATSAEFMADSAAAVEFYAHLTELVADGKYDRIYEPSFQGFIFAGKRGHEVQALRGLRAKSD